MYYHPNDVLKYHTIGSHQLATSSALKTSVNSPGGGIGFLLSPKAIDNVLTVKSISPKIMVLELGGNPKTTIACVYSPTNSSSANEIDDFYTSFRSSLFFSYSW